MAMVGFRSTLYLPFWFSSNNGAEGSYVRLVIHFSIHKLRDADVVVDVHLIFLEDVWQLLANRISHEEVRVGNVVTTFRCIRNGDVRLKRGHDSGR